MSNKYVKTKYRGVFRRNGIAYIRYSVPGKKRGSDVWESTGQRNAQLAAERLQQRKTEIAEGRYFPNRRFEKAPFKELAEYWWENCQCRDKTPAILPTLPICAAVSLGGDAVGTLQ